MTAFLQAPHRRLYADAAAHERDERERVYPKRIADGKIEAGDAEADYQAWCAIALWCEGRAIPWEISLATMELATARALQTAEAAVAAKPADPIRRARRDDVAEIHAIVSRTRAFVDTLNADFRRRAGRAQAA